MQKKFDLEQIMGSVNVGILVTDAICRVTFFNKHAAECLDLNETKTIDPYISDILPLAGFVFKECIETGVPQLGYNLQGNGNDIIGNVTPILQRKKVVGIVCCFLEKEYFERTMNKLESFECLTNELEAIFSSSAYGNWLCDGDGTVLKLNKAAEELNGIKAKDVIGKKAWWLVENGYVDRSCTGQVVKTRRRVKIIQHMLKTDKDLMTTATPVLDHRGNLFRVVVNQYEITGLNKIRKELTRSRSVTEKYKDELSSLRMLALKNNSFIAESKKMKQILRIALKLASIGTSEILIQGESGVGKGLLAKFIHKNSNRSKEPFVQINCAALPETLLEAELFGYEKGAFTGASDKGKVGLIELAKNGTLFLDEVGDIPLSIQTKLLTYLDDHIVRPLGGVQEKHINCAIITATNKDLFSLIRQRKFREDLYFRLNTFTVAIPPLRERPEDIFELTNQFLKKYNKTYRQKRRLSGGLMNRLQSYHFPGNVRELDSLIKQAVVMSEDDVLDKCILSTLGIKAKVIDASCEDKCNLTEMVQKFEKEIIERFLSQHATTRGMAKNLGINQSTVVRKLKKHGLSNTMMQNSIN